MGIVLPTGVAQLAGCSVPFNPFPGGEGYAHRKPMSWGQKEGIWQPHHPTCHRHHQLSCADGLCGDHRGQPSGLIAHGALPTAHCSLLPQCVPHRLRCPHWPLLF